MPKILLNTFSSLASYEIIKNNEKPTEGDVNQYTEQEFQGHHQQFFHWVFLSTIVSKNMLAWSLCSIQEKVVILSFFLN